MRLVNVIALVDNLTFDVTFKQRFNLVRYVPLVWLFTFALACTFPTLVTLAVTVGYMVVDLRSLIPRFLYLTTPRCCLILPYRFTFDVWLSIIPVYQRTLLALLFPFYVTLYFHYLLVALPSLPYATYVVASSYVACGSAQRADLLLLVHRVRFAYVERRLVVTCIVTHFAFAPLLVIVVGCFWIVGLLFTLYYLIGHLCFSPLLTCCLIVIVIALLT